MHRGAWQATIHRVAKSLTQLKWPSMQAAAGIKRKHITCSFIFSPFLPFFLFFFSSRQREASLLIKGWRRKLLLYNMCSAWHGAAGILYSGLVSRVMPSNHLTLSSLLLLRSIFPSIRVFSNESTLRIRWPKYWSFSFSPSTEHSGLISLRTDWRDRLVSREGRGSCRLAGRAIGCRGFRQRRRSTSEHRPLRPSWTEVSGVAIALWELWFEVVGARPLHTASCEQMKPDQANRKREKG